MQVLFIKEVSRLDYITVKQYAELKGCTTQYVQKALKDGKIGAVQQINPQNNKMQYLIPVSALPEEIKAKYYKSIAKECPVPAPKKTEKTALKQSENAVKKPFEMYSEAERQEINLWSRIIKDWQANRALWGKKTEFDRNYVGKLRLEHPELDISVDILYRKYTAYKAQDLDGLIDKRGGWNKGISSIPEPVWEWFLWVYLDERKPPLARCYELAKDWTAEFYPDLVNQLPSERSFRRRIQSDLSEALLTYLRDGDKACNDRCLPYITRMYDKLHANDVWIADNHTLDVQSTNADGQTHRLHLTAFLDAKSGVIVGWNLTDNPCSQSTIIALRHGIKHFGIPKILYFDNGSEFLTHDIGGRGHRKRKNMVDDPPTILEHLGIEMRNALVRNAKAKPIERTFYTFKNHFSKALAGYCGGTVLERPESLKRIIKNGELPRDFAVRDLVDSWIENDFNQQPYGGSERKYKGMKRIEVWNSDIKNVGVRMAEESELNLMLARTTRFQKIKRNGVYVELFGEKIWYYDQETVTHIGEEVYVRYDPAELTSVRIYDAKTDKYLWTWSVADSLMMDYITMSKEEVGEGQSIIRNVKRRIIKDARGLTAHLTEEQRISALDMMVRRAEAKKNDIVQATLPKTIIPIHANEPQEIKQAVGAETIGVTIDLDRMAENARKRKE